MESDIACTIENVLSEVESAPIGCQMQAYKCLQSGPGVLKFEQQPGESRPGVSLVADAHTSDFLDKKGFGLKGNNSPTQHGIPSTRFRLWCFSFAGGLSRARKLTPRTGTRCSVISCSPRQPQSQVFIVMHVYACDRHCELQHKPETRCPGSIFIGLACRRDRFQSQPRQVSQRLSLMVPSHSNRDE